eukprot:gene12125-5616_t
MSKQQQEKVEYADAPLTFVAVSFIIFSLSLFFILPLPTKESITIYASYFFFQCFCAKFLQGTIVTGLPQEDGTTYKYNCNGLQAYLLSIVVFLTGGYFKIWSLGCVYENLIPLITTCNMFAYLCWMVLFIKGKFSNKRVPYDGIVKEIWLGAEKDPRIFGVDVKLFMDGRVSLLAWVIVSLSYLSVHYEKFGMVSNAMLIYQIMAFLYMLDFFYFEEEFISGFEIYKERMGFQLTWGNINFMPFIPSLQGYFLIEYKEISNVYLAIVVLIWVLGYVIARSANNQKDVFKKDSEKTFKFLFNLIEMKPKYIKTEAGKKILTSGFWGWSQHPNYFGELLNSLSFCMMCGISYGIFPYAYAIFIWTLLFTRFERDSHVCAKKYGASWGVYKKQVPYKIIPFLY